MLPVNGLDAFGHKVCKTDVRGQNAMFPSNCLGTVLKPTEEELRHGVILGCKLLFSQVWISLAVQQYRLNHRVSAF